MAEETSLFEEGTSNDDSTTPINGCSAPPPLLPPCRICGARASGFQYGANTSEACKGFFRRSLVRRKDYKCVQGDSSCVIGPQKRSGCSHCRLQKCLALGMSKEAIKTGRYTHEKKTSDTREVKRLKRNAAIETSDQRLDEIVNKVLQAHRRQFVQAEGTFCDQQKKTHQLMDQQLTVSGPLRAIDVDKLEENMLQMIAYMELDIKRFIAFVKVLPGFKELPMDDQVTLIKDEIWPNRRREIV